MKDYTVSTFAEELGVSWNSVYKTGKELQPDKKWGKNAVLNGSTEMLLNHYSGSSKSTVARKAKKLLSYFNESMINTIEINEANQQGFTEETKSESTVESLSESLVEINGNHSLISTEESLIRKFFDFDLGRAILGSPLIRFIFVVAMISGQSYMFAMLEQKVMKGTDFNIETGYAIAVGILFEAVGFMIALSIDSKKMIGEYSTRNCWLSLIFVFQCITNLCLIEPFSVPGLALPAGRFIIAISLPVGIAAYSYLYFRDNEKKAS